MARRKQTLTPGETDVLDLIERGNAVDQIAETKGISKPAVYHYIRRLKDKGHLHADQKVASKGVPNEDAPMVQPAVHVGGNGGTAASNGASYSFEVAFDTLLKSSTAEAEAAESLAGEIKATEEMLAEMRERLALMESRRDSLRDAGRALNAELADTSQFAMAE